MASEDQRKDRIMEHLSKSTGQFFKRSPNASNTQRKQQVMDHVRRTRG
ncbi:MAG: hypothetical protein VKL39_17785 [Leptolyngbyaceae bacterium]|nr:hypothetical protein [Leptolyngbyaceae bacterium]